MSTFGWLRRYEKIERELISLGDSCRKFTAELPTVFPQDPWNLRETRMCRCHATLDPLADFFKSWGEGGELHTGEKILFHFFGGKSGSYVADIADIVRSDNAFSTCTVQNAWNFLIGRGFYDDEADLRAALTDYFVKTNYDFKDLHAIATHPVFLMSERGCRGYFTYRAAPESPWGLNYLIVQLTQLYRIVPILPQLHRRIVLVVITRNRSYRPYKYIGMERFKVSCCRTNS